MEQKKSSETCKVQFLKLLDLSIIDMIRFYHGGGIYRKQYPGTQGSHQALVR